ncbi:MAG: hypothetical protein HYX73_05570 [Acidobacteria bacterium]|nr:hypothetical protein [Acidobacteriota bacterium]
MKKDLVRSKADPVANSGEGPTRKHQAWFALWALILGVIIGNSVSRENVPALIAFAVAIAAASLLVSKGHGLSIPVYSILGAMLLALINPKLLAFFGAGGPSGYHWTTLGALAGFGLLATSFAAAWRANRAVTSAATQPASQSHRAVSTYDLVLTTVSKIPTFVKRLRPLPRAQSAEDRLHMPANPAEFLCRALPTPTPTPPGPIRRWPGREDRR